MQQVLQQFLSLLFLYPQAKLFLKDGYRLYDFIENGILKTINLNRKVNKEYLVSDKIDGKTKYYFPAERFEELLINYYK